MKKKMIFPMHPELGQEIEAYLEATGMPPTTFAKNATGDPSCLNALIAGRELKQATLKKLRMFMLTGQRYRPEKPKDEQPGPDAA